MRRAEIQQFVPLLEQEMMRGGGDEWVGQFPKKEFHESGGRGDVHAQLFQIHDDAFVVLLAKFLQRLAVAVHAEQSLRRQPVMLDEGAD